MNEPTNLFGDVDQEAMYQQAIRVPLNQKIQIAIMMIQTFEPQALALSPNGYHVCFSGGKDSIVMARLFEMAGVEYTLNYNNVTIDPPELVQFIKREYPQAIWHHVGMNLTSYMAHNGKGLPRRMSRWCCDIYKEQGGAGCFTAIGVRAAESPRRKGLWQPIRTHKKHKTPIICPILYWTDEDIWSFIRQYEMKYCSLYDEGFKRLGCVGCPMSNNRQKEFERWPKYEQMWKRGTKLFFEKWHGVPRKDGKVRSVTAFKSWQELWSWWMQETNVNDTDQPDCQLWLW